jgi:large subunit ribosomal protein L4e
LKEIITARGHKIGNIENFPIIISDEIETIEHTKDIIKILNSLNLMEDVNRLKSRKPRTGKSALRGRGKKIGKSILFVVSKSEKLAKACGTSPGIDVKMVKELSVLDLAPGASPIRLTVYSKSALDDIAKIKSSHLELMVTIK